MIRYWHVGLIAAIFIGGILSLFASSEPDGLERVAEDYEFIEEGKEVVNSPLSEYMTPGIEDETLSASVAGIIGVLIMFSLALLIGRALKK